MAGGMPIGGDKRVTTELYARAHALSLRDGLPAAGGGTAGAGGPGALVDLNSASADQLDELPGVGPTTAEAIIPHREQNGPFATVDDLLDVRGIGEAKLEQLRGLVTV